MLQSPWTDHSTPSHFTKIIAYVRTDRDPPTHTEQLELIQQYCEKFGYEVVSIFEDQSDIPGAGLARALEALKNVGGLIVFDLDRLVHNKSDRLRDLKPLLHEFFCSAQKHLLTVREGINTATPAGQLNVVELLTAVKEFE